MSRAKVCRSWYSDMSSRTIARSSSNMNSASARASSVFPTPVGPGKMNDALGLVRHCRELDLELPHSTVGLVELDRRGVDLHAQARRGLVDEVDRLVGKEAVRDVAVGEHRRGDERRVADLDAVVGLVALFEATQ